MKKRNLIWYMFLLLPILDAINGILDRQYSKSIGTYYHVFFTIFLIFMVITCKQKKMKGRHFLWFTLFFFDVTLGILFNNFLGIDSNLIAFDLMAKLVCTVLNFECLFILTKESILESSFFDRILTVTGFIIPIGSFISMILGIGNTAYIYSERGFLGFYTSSNELNCILLILCYHSLSHYLNEKKNYYLVSFFLQIICALMIESKISSGLCFLAVLILINGIIKRGSFKIKKSMMIIVVLIVIALYALSQKLTTMVTSFLIRQESLQSLYMGTSGSIFDYLSSGRSVRFGDIFNANYIWNESLKSVFINCVRFLLGNGFYNYLPKMYFEMEFFDTFIWMGCLGILLLLMAFYYIVRLSKKKQNNWLNCSSTLIAMICSFFTGHVLCGGVAGIYFVVTCLNTMFYSRRKE